MIEKQAKSSDPKQQALRDLKKKWQKEMKVFIAQSIALKRGVGGVGDARAGLPPSNIKDPLPNEVSIYIDEMITRFNNLVETAKQIVKEQESYSQTRTKSRKELSIAAEDFNPIEKLASNEFTRLWVKWTQTPWFKDDKTTKARLKLLSSLANLKDSVNDIEYTISSREDRAVVSAFFMMVRFLGQFQTRFVDKVIEENKRQAAEIVGIPPTEIDVALSSPVVVPADVAEKLKNTKKNNRDESRREDEAAQDYADETNNKTGTPGEVEEIKTISLDIQNIGAIVAQVNVLSELGKLSDINKDEFKFYVSEASKINLLAEQALINKDFSKYSLIKKDYESLVSSISNTLKIPNVNNLSDISGVLNIKAKGFADPVIKKIAKKKFERWMRRLNLGLYSDELSKTKLEVARKLRDLSKDMDSILDQLEGKNLTLAALFAHLADIYTQVASVAYDFVNLANDHNAQYGEQKASGEKPELGPINKTDINNILKYISKLLNEVDSIRGRGVSQIEDEK